MSGRQKRADMGEKRFHSFTKRLVRSSSNVSEMLSEGVLVRECSCTIAGIFLHLPFELIDALNNECWKKYLS